MGLILSPGIGLRTDISKVGRKAWQQVSRFDIDRIDGLQSQTSRWVISSHSTA